MALDAVEEINANATEFRDHMEVADFECLALRTAIAKAITDLDAEHQPNDSDEFIAEATCVSCTAWRWPCPSARVADDLRKAVES